MLHPIIVLIIVGILARDADVVPQWGTIEPVTYCETSIELGIDQPQPPTCIVLP